MKRRIALYLGLAFLSLCNSLLADEGMWLLSMIHKLNMDSMKALGLKLSAEDIYSINNSSLKDAVVIFGNGCTGELVSEDGLLFTNHHCGNDYIQNHSTVEHNYLDDGFWAMNRSEELPNPDLTVSFLIRMEDVSEKMLHSISDTLAERERVSTLRLRSDSIEEAAIAGTHYIASVKPMFGGNNYYLFVYEVFTDVRLVGAPPVSIGNFGGDTDNWVWPRHTGDFSIFRVYAGPDGKPAKYSKDNVPLKPRHYLPVSLKPREEGDFAMILGYPAGTTRFMTSYEIRELRDLTNTNRISIRGKRLEILKEDMQADEKVNIQYASKYTISSNYWKYSIGQNEGIEKLGTIEKRENEEKEFSRWVNADEKRMEKYGEALEMIRKSVKDRKEYRHVIQYTNECFFTACEVIAFANRANNLYLTLKSSQPDEALIASRAEELKTSMKNFREEYNPQTDMKMISAMMQLFEENVPAAYLPDFYNQIGTEYKNNYDQYATDLVNNSIFSNRDKFDQFIASPDAEILENDPAFKVVLSVNDVYRKAYYRDAELKDMFQRGQRLFIAGLKQMDSTGRQYPDANSTMRLSYGTVCDYMARDAVHFLYFTTLAGVMEKVDSVNPEFIVPEKLKMLYQEKDYGIYGENGQMTVAFISNNDITGGNSGSPVIDGEGNLIGLAFDGNWEAMTSNIAYEPFLQRCICVDIRYVLFIIDKFAGASHLIKELKIVNSLAYGSEIN